MIACCGLLIACCNNCGENIIAFLIDVTDTNKIINLSEKIGNTNKIFLI